MNDDLIKLNREIRCLTGEYRVLISKEINQDILRRKNPKLNEAWDEYQKLLTAAKVIQNSKDTWNKSKGEKK